MDSLYRFKFWLALMIAFSSVGIALAHPGQPIAPHDLWSAWNNDFFLLLTLELSFFVYLWGIWKVWRGAGLGRGISVRQCICFISALLTLIVALVSPLDALSGALFSVHMTQHMLLILIAAPLLAFSGFPIVVLWALPRGRSQTIGRYWKRYIVLRRVWRFVTKPSSSWILFAVTLWIWHAPLLYQAALNNQTIHNLEHIGFLLTALLFWWVLINPSRPAYWRYGVGIPYLFTTALHSSILGVLLTFATQPWYPFYAETVAAWGLSPLQDQQLAGLLMWLPIGAVFTLLSIYSFASWLGMVDQRTALALHLKVVNAERIEDNSPKSIPKAN
jgi:putative membrane protein